MSRSLLSRRRAELARLGAGALAAVLVVGLLWATSGHAEESGCGPFESRYEPIQLASAEQGVVPARDSSAPSGSLVDLPEPAGTRPEAPTGEVLLALPKASDGSIPTDFELGPGARIALSFFSPILCATVARVVGPAGATPEALVPVVPATATVVANALYLTAASEVAPPLDRGPDPYRRLQYGLDQLGIDASRSLSSGAGVRVAVLDSAPDASHRDLGPIEITRLEGGPPSAAAVHGTLVTGLIAAIEENGFGMAGVAPGVETVAVPVCTPLGATASDSCLLFDVLRGVDLAWEREAQLVNLSIVGPANALLERAMARLDQLGVLVVASAGNEGVDAPRYPAAYPSVIGVGAVDRSGARYARSNRGASAELLAPGVEILSAVPGNAFAFGSGTSYAAAHVTGTLAVLIGAGVEPSAARAALFREADTQSSGPVSGGLRLPPICDVLERLGHACPSP